MTYGNATSWQMVIDAIENAQMEFWNSSRSYIIKASAPVDGNMWHTITVNKDAARWIRTQTKEHWYEHPSNTIAMFDVSDKLLLLLKITWP